MTAFLRWLRGLLPRRSTPNVYRVDLSDPVQYRAYQHGFHRGIEFVETAIRAENRGK